jgi:hypothetical protein
MKKVLFSFIAVLLICSLAIAGQMETVVNSSKSATISVPTTGAVYTYSMPIGQNDNANVIGVMYKVSPATADVAVYFQQSYARPATEGSSSTAYLNTHTLDASATGGNWEMATVDTIRMPFGRFYLQGNSSNPATTTISIKIFK